jgi:hypothetical protein
MHVNRHVKDSVLKSRAIQRTLLFILLSELSQHYKITVLMV